MAPCPEGKTSRKFLLLKCRSSVRHVLSHACTCYTNTTDTSFHSCKTLWWWEVHIQTSFAGGLTRGKFIQVVRHSEMLLYVFMGVLKNFQLVHMFNYTVIWHNMNITYARLQYTYLQWSFLKYRNLQLASTPGCNITDCSDSFIILSHIHEEHWLVCADLKNSAMLCGPKGHI